MISIYLFVTGSVLLVIATYISTVHLYRLEQKISETTPSIDKQSSSTRHNLLMIIMYELKHLKYQMDNFQHNVLLQLKTPTEHTDHLKKRMERDMGRIAEGWSTLWTEAAYEEIKKEISSKIEAIKGNEALSNEEKLDKLEAIWIDGVSRFNTKQKEAEKQAEKDRRTLESLKKRNAIWKRIFAIAQISGLILVGWSQFTQITVSK